MPPPPPFAGAPPGAPPTELPPVAPPPPWIWLLELPPPCDPATVVSLPPAHAPSAAALSASQSERAFASRHLPHRMPSDSSAVASSRFSIEAKVPPSPRVDDSRSEHLRTRRGSSPHKLALK